MVHNFLSFPILGYLSESLTAIRFHYFYFFSVGIITVHVSDFMVKFHCRKMAIKMYVSRQIMLLLKIELLVEITQINYI